MVAAPAPDNGGSLAPIAPSVADGRAGRVPASESYHGCRFRAGGRRVGVGGSRAALCAGEFDPAGLFVGSAIQSSLVHHPEDQDHLHQVIAAATCSNRLSRLGGLARLALVTAEDFP